MTTHLIFAKLAVWEDSVPRAGPEQMACDEALLMAADIPVLRIFRWASPWVSAGFFVPYDSAQAVRPDLPVCRRWTGGGVVVHEGDFTFSMAVPRHEKWALMRPRDAYHSLHRAIANALRQSGVSVELAQEDTGQEECFASPVRDDVLADGRKVVGGAQRRTRRGLLHQGSIQIEGIRRNFTSLLAANLAIETTPWHPRHELEENVRQLAYTKYAREEFLARGLLKSISLHSRTTSKQ